MTAVNVFHCILISSQFIDDDPDALVIPDAGTNNFTSDDEYADCHQPAKRRRVQDVDANDDEEEDDPNLPNLHPRDPSNFFKLSAALRLLLSHKITDGDIDQADKLLREYCLELSEVSLCMNVASDVHHSQYTFTAIWT